MRCERRALMEIVPLAEFKAPESHGLAVTLGNFDGVHRGHRLLVEEVLRLAREQGDRAAVLTYEPHPARVLRPEAAPAALMTVAQKAEALAALGVDLLLVQAFTSELARMSAEDYARQVLSEALHARTVVLGSGFRFGRGRRGDVPALRAQEARLGFAVHELPPVMDEGLPVSSTRVREALTRGEVERAAELLGHPFVNIGPVVTGDGRGRTIGLPTANLEPENAVVPADGVYAAFARPAANADARPWPAVVNVGRRPTFGGGARSVEAHLLDFEGDLYGRRLALAYRHRLRDERRFSGVDELLAQVRADIALARRLLEKG